MFPGVKLRSQPRSKPARPECNEQTMTPLTDHILNDDCLEHIFSFLQIKDLMNVHETCTQFQRVAQIVIPKRRMIKVHKEFYAMRLLEFRTFLELFGPTVKEISIDALCLDYQVRESRFFKLIIECFYRDCELESLELINFYGLSIPLLNFLSPIFSKLKKLSLERMPLPISIPYLIKKWSNLRELHLNHCHRTDDRTLSQSRTLSEFPLEFQSKLEKLSLIKNSYLSILPLTVRSHLIFTELKELSIHPTLFGERISLQLSFHTTIRNITKIRTLNILRIDVGFMNLNEFLEISSTNLPHLKILEINYARLTRDENCFNLFKRFTELERLKLYAIQKLKGKHIPKIAKQLPSLVELDLQCKINTHYLVQVLQVCPKLSHLNVEMHSKHELTEDIVEKILNLFESQRRIKPLKLSIYNHNFEPITNSELLSVERYNQNPLINITRWP